MSTSIISTLVECKNYKDKIIPKITSSLEDKGFNVSSSSNNEIFIETDDLTKINSIISDMDIPSEVKNVIIDTYKTKEGVYVRLKFK